MFSRKYTVRIGYTCPGGRVYAMYMPSLPHLNSTMASGTPEAGSCCRRRKRNLDAGQEHPTKRRMRKSSLRSRSRCTELLGH